jgi:hypothetical protein
MTQWAGALALLNWVTSSLAHPTNARGERGAGGAEESIARLETAFVWPTLLNDVSTVVRDISETLAATSTHGVYVSASDNNTKDIERGRATSSETTPSEKGILCSSLENVSPFVVWK